MKEQRVEERVFGAVELCGQVLEIGGMRLEPDQTKAYAEFKLAHGFTKASRVVTAYGTTFHPSTVANSYKSMLHQVFDLGHRLRAYDASKERDEIPRDYAMGTVVGVEFPAAPAQGWTVTLESAPAIRGAAVIHKQLEKVPQVLGEHLAGRHKWTVSLEMDYNLMESGWVVMNRPEATATQERLLAETTPREFADLGLGYVPMPDAPESLLESWSPEKRRVAQPWGKLPVAIMKGGINGMVHFKGVGLVRYGAEKEAEVQQILASDPDRLWEEPVGALVDYFAGVERAVAGLV